MQDLDFDTLIANTQAFMETMHIVRDDFSLIPQKDHIGTCINYSDLIEMRDDFIEELIGTVTSFVYSKSKQETIKQDFMRKRDEAAASQKLLKRARSKFRKRNKSNTSSHLQGQFSELLLFNLLQHYYNAIPLLRKMPITTNPEIERHGADAIHITKDKEIDKYILYLGEAKTYNRSQSSGLKDALKDAVDDIVNVHYKKHRKELELYTYEDFLPTELEQIARDYIDGSLKNVEVHLVCIVTYNLDFRVTGMAREEILDNTIQNIRDQTRNITNSKVFRELPDPVKPRLNYILFPVEDMNNLIDLFANELGG